MWAEIFPGVYVGGMGRKHKADADLVSLALNEVNATEEQRYHALILEASEGRGAALLFCETLRVAGEIGDVFDASAMMREAELTF